MTSAFGQQRTPSKSQCRELVALKANKEFSRIGFIEAGRHCNRNRIEACIISSASLLLDQLVGLNITAPAEIDQNAFGAAEIAFDSLSRF